MIEMLHNSDEYWREIAQLREQRIDSLEKAVGLFLESKGMLVSVDEYVKDIFSKVNKLDSLNSSANTRNQVLLRRANRKKNAWKWATATVTVIGTAAVTYYRFIWKRED